MKNGWLFQQDNVLTLVNESGEEFEIFNDIGSNSNIGFAVAPDAWQLSIVDDKGLRFFSSINGKEWETLPDIPTGISDEYTFKLLPHKNTMAVFFPGILYYRKDSAWKSLPLPKGATWGDLDVEGNWNVIGAKPATKTKRSLEKEAALWKQVGDKWSEIPIQASWWDAYKTISNGGFEALEGIDAIGNPFILASQCAWFMDDPSWFIFTRQDSGKFKIQRLKNRMLTQISSSSTKQLFTQDGEIWSWTGKKWEPNNVASQLQKSLTPIAGYSVHINTNEANIFGVLTEYAQNGVKKSAIFSHDGGKTWKRFTKKGGIPIASWCHA